MSRYQYEFCKFGVLMRKNRLAVTDSYGNHICGKPEFVWWWPVNWVVVGGCVLVLMPIALWIEYKKRKGTTP